MHLEVEANSLYDGITCKSNSSQRFDYLTLCGFCKVCP